CMPVAVTRSHRPSCADTAVTLHTSQHTAIAHCPAVCHLAMLVICQSPTTGLPLAYVGVPFLWVQISCHAWGSLAGGRTRGLEPARHVRTRRWKRTCLAWRAPPGAGVVSLG